MSRTCLVSSTSISNSNANPHRVAILWPCLPDLGGPFCVGPVHLHFIETCGGGYCRDFQPKPSPPISIKCRDRFHTGRATKGWQAWPKKGHLVRFLAKSPKKVGKEGTLSKKTASWRLTRLGAAVLRKSAPIGAGQSC